MESTLDLMKTILIGNYSLKDYKSLSDEYKTNLNPSILAEVFYRNFGQIKNLGEKYYLISEEDLASYSLEILDKCLRNYDSGKAQFITYFTNNLNFKLRADTSLLSTHKRKANYNVEDIDDHINMVDEVSDLSILDVDMDEILNKYCKLIMEGFSNSDISKMLGVSTTTLHNYRKRLRVILS